MLNPKPKPNHSFERNAALNRVFSSQLNALNHCPRAEETSKIPVMGLITLVNIMITMITGQSNKIHPKTHPTCTTS